MKHDDTDEIVALLTARLNNLLDTYVPGWVEHRGRAYLSAKSEKELGSWQVNLTGRKRGQWYRFSQKIGGGPIKLLAYILSGEAGEPTREDLARAFDEARTFLGMSSGEIDHDAARRAIEQAERRRAKEEEEARAEARKRAEDARWTWDRGVPIAGTPAERYLRRRCIELDEWPDCLRFARSIYHRSGVFSPALLCRVDDPAGAFTGVWRIYITADGDKAPFGGEVKLGLGPVAGGAVRLFPPSNGMVAIAEGVETALSVHLLSRRSVPVWSVLSTSGMSSFQPPLDVDRVVIFPDWDLPRVHRSSGRFIPSPGITAANALRDRLLEEGVACGIDQSIPHRGRDFNDLLRAVARRAA